MRVCAGTWAVPRGRDRLRVAVPSPGVAEVATGMPAPECLSSEVVGGDSRPFGCLLTPPALSSSRPAQSCL